MEYWSAGVVGMIVWETDRRGTPGWASLLVMLYWNVLALGDGLGFCHIEVEAGAHGG